MKTTYLERRWGGGGRNPTEAELREALAELEQEDAEHPDCWLSDENNLTISAYHGGKVVLENPETGEGPQHLKDQTPEDILKLWLFLQDGDLTGIRSKTWKEGY